MEATLEPRLVMKGEAGTPYVEGEFFVAGYQRGYRWGREEVRQLLDDIRANAKDAEEKRTAPADYYLQPIVVLRRGDNSWELVDGQQRLTTLFLITKYIGTKLQDAQVGYRLTYETRERSREYLDTLDPSLSDGNIDYYHIGMAYRAIEEWFNEPSHGTPLQSAIDLHTALTKWVYVIWYEAPERTNPNDLFIRLNRDRIPLTDAELIKALVLTNSRTTDGRLWRQEEIAAQWDGFERDLRDAQMWAFLTGATVERSTHIDFLFESMTPAAGLRVRPRYWTFGEVHKRVQERGGPAFWGEVVERYGVLSGWYHDRELYHRIGYLLATGDSVPALIALSRSLTHRAFRDSLIERTRRRLRLSRDDVSMLRYGKDDRKCTAVLLLMNVEAVLCSGDPGSRFSFHAYAGGGWSLEHIHAQNAQALKTETQRREWLQEHVKKIRSTVWTADAEESPDAIAALIDDHLALAPGKTDDLGFQDVVDKVFRLFGAPDGNATDVGTHGLGNLALLQRDFNSQLNNAVFALKRERILKLDENGAYILPCTRNVFLKYYTATEDQQLSIWGPQDQKHYYEKLLQTIRI